MPISSPSDRLRLWRDTRRVAVLGTASSGKSTFLTSVIDRLHRPAAGRHAERLPPFETEGGFPYEYYREDCLGSRWWPDKTVASSQYRCRLTHGGAGLAGFLRAQLAEECTFFDLPGERVSDFGMAGKTYAEWSDAWFEEARASRPYAAYARDYLALTLAGGELRERETLLAYKRVLARFTRELVPLVTPSTFLVDEDGRYPANTDPPANELGEDELVRRGLTGLNPAHEFAPLPGPARRSNAPLTRHFEAGFDLYRRRLAEPLAAGFNACDTLLVLVDVGAVLEGGPAAYRSTRRTLQAVLDALEPGHSLGQRLGGAARRLLTGGRAGAPRAGRVGLVATKADCVHRFDRPHLSALLRQMADDLFRESLARRHLKLSYFHCAAVRATRDADDYPCLEGWLPASPDDPGAAEYSRFAVSPVPAAWPAESEWDRAAYRFAQVLPPPLDLLGERPFPDIHLDEVMKFIGVG